MILEGFPNLSVINAMRHHVDFYMLNGQAVARRWPRNRYTHSTDAALWAQNAMRLYWEFMGYQPAFFSYAWSTQVVPQARTSIDCMKSIFLWLAHHHYVRPDYYEFPGKLFSPPFVNRIRILRTPFDNRIDLWFLPDPRFDRLKVSWYYRVVTPDHVPGYDYVYTSRRGPAPDNEPMSYLYQLDSWTPAPNEFYGSGGDSVHWFLPPSQDFYEFHTEFRFEPDDTNFGNRIPTSPVWSQGDFSPVPPWPDPYTGRWPYIPYWPTEYIPPPLD